MVTVSSPLRPSVLPARPLLEHQRQHAHADEVRAVDALEALRDDGAHAEELRALGRPVARRAGAVFAPREHDERNLLRLIAHRRVIDRQTLAGGLHDRQAALDHVARLVLHHLVLDADIGERAAHHHFVIAAAGAVLVEVDRPHLMLDEILTGRARGLDRARGRNVVGGDRIEEEREDARVLDVGDRDRRLGQPLEIGRVLHIGRARCPRRRSGPRALSPCASWRRRRTRSRTLS